ITASGNPTTIPSGGTITVTVTVSNDTSEPAPIDLWIVAERNDNPVLTRRIGNGTLPAGVTVTRSFALRSPGNTPPGTYTINANVGDYPDMVLATDAFDVTVTSSERFPGESFDEAFVVAPFSGDVFGDDAITSSLLSIPEASVLASP